VSHRYIFFFLTIRPILYIKVLFGLYPCDCACITGDYRAHVWNTYKPFLFNDTKIFYQIVFNDKYKYLGKILLSYINLLSIRL